METLLSFIQHYGYIFIFVATLFEGETVVALGGFAAFQGYLALDGVVFAAFLGGMFGDQIFFYFGRFRGMQFIESRPKFFDRLKKVHHLIERYQNLLIFGSRYMYGFRILIPLTFGTSRVSGIRFFIFNFLGAATWAVLFSSIGYFLGNALEVYIVHFHKAEKYVLIGVLTGIAIVQGISFVYRRIEKRVERAEERVSRDNPKAGAE